MAGQGRSKKQGGLETRKRRSFRILLGIWIVGFLALVVGGAFAVYDVRSTASAAVVPAPAPVIAAPQVAAITESAPAPTPTGLATALGPAVTNPGLGAFTGSVTDAATGTVLWSHEPERPMTPASTTKLLTTAAA